MVPNCEPFNLSKIFWNIDGKGKEREKKRKEEKERDRNLFFKYFIMILF